MNTSYLICDIDGTLSDTSHRIHFVKNKPKDWKSFFSLMSEDPPILATINLLRLIKQSSKPPIVVLTSGRPSQYLGITTNWLKSYEVPYDLLLMREQKDNRPDFKVKKEMLTELRKRFRNDPLFVIDDRRSVVNMWREEGLVCYQIQDNSEF